MMTLLLMIVPLLAAVWTVLGRRRRGFAAAGLAAGAFGHAVLTALLIARPGWDWSCPWLAQWVGQDELSRVFLGITSFLFLMVTLYALVWVPAEKRAAAEAGEKGQKSSSDTLLSAGLLVFLSTMTLVVSARNFGLLWVAVEATTLASAPLILFHRSGQSLEAMWKYLLICSVGIALALFGTMLLAVSAQESGAGLGMEALRNAELRPQWYKAAFIFILAGYGTKMGLAPFHTWLPDAHSEAPGCVSALLSGALLNCSFLGIIRVFGVAPELLTGFCRELLIGLGVFSLALAAFFILRQSDYKRMLAYSSVEHMGLLAIMWGTGAETLALWHMCGHSVIKMTLFLLAGNLLLACGTRKIARLGGLLGKLPRTSTLWIAATLLICGVPPSPLFVTEFLLIRSWTGVGLGVAVVLLLLVVFAGMTRAVLSMTMGASGEVEPDVRNANAAEKLWAVPLCALIPAVAGGVRLTILLLKGM